jgi:hypothetical protein
MNIPSAIAIQILEAVAEPAFDSLDVDGRVVKLAKIIEHHLAPKYAKIGDGPLTVMSREECVFVYCSNPLSCQSICRFPRGSTIKYR